MKETGQILKLISRVKIIDTIALIVAIVSIAISCILILLFGDTTFNLDNELISTFIWFSIIGSIWTCVLSTVVLTISIIIYRLNNKEIWHPFKQEILLTLGIAAGLTILHLCTLTIY